METTIKTIDIEALEWFDKVNGNSYFAAQVTTNFGMDDAKTYTLPFQYGYGDHYVSMAAQELDNAGVIKLPRYSNGSTGSLWQYCDENKIILRKTKHTNCLKRELKAFGANV